MLKESDLQITDNNKLQRYINTRQNEYRKQTAILEQKIEFLETELHQYKQKDTENRKLNQSIILSYKNNDPKDDGIVKSIKDITKKHNEEMNTIRLQHSRQIKHYEQQLRTLNQRLDHVSISNEKLSLQNEKRIAQIKAELQNHYMNKAEQQLQQYRKKNQALESKLKKAENTIRIYKQYIERLNYTEQKTEILRQQPLNIQYSFITDDKNQEKKIAFREKSMLLNQEDLTCSIKNSRFQHTSRQSKEQNQRIDRSKRSNSIIQFCQNNVYKRTESKSKLQKQKSYKTFKIEDSIKTSHKYLEMNKENLDQLTSRISKAVNQLEKTTKAGLQNRKIDFLKQKINRKLKLF